MAKLRSTVWNGWVILLKAEHFLMIMTTSDWILRDIYRNGHLPLPRAILQVDRFDFDPNMEDKAATIVYLSVKNHDFSAGNKSIAAAKDALSGQ